MTAWATVDLAIEGLRHRVGDFVRKPWDNEQLLATVRAQVMAARSRRAAEKLHERELVLRPGDRLVLFTDGLTELPDAHGVEFGEARLVELVTNQRQLDAAALKETLLEAAHAFGGGSFVDDTTLLVLAVG